MAAGVTIDRDAFADRRIARLGELGGYSHMEALGRLATLWSRCTELQTDVPGEIELDACLGDGGGARLVKCGLGEKTDDGQVRVKGCNGRIEWFRDHAARSTAGGKKRAQNASRDQRGRLISQPRLDVAGPATPSQGPADHQPPPAQDQVQEDLSARSGSPRPVSASSPDRGPRDLVNGVLPDAELRKLLWPIEQRLNGVRRELAAELGMKTPLHEHPSGEDATDAMSRLRESGPDPMSYFEHVLAVAIAEAKQKGSLQYLGWCLFRPKAWNAKVRSSVSDAARKPSGGVDVFDALADEARKHAQERGEEPDE